MYKTRNLLPLVLACGLSVGLFSLQAAQAEERPGLKILSTDALFEDAAFELENAIIDRGLKIDYRGDIGKMMERTAADFGGDRSNYKNAKFITFCSVPLTRDMVRADPQNIGFCPYIVFVYELRTEPGKSYVGYRRPLASGSQASVTTVNAIDELLAAIVKQAAE